MGTEKRESLRFLKRILCSALAVICVFFTGCNSILINGDLHFTSFPAPTLPPSDMIENAVKNISQDSQTSAEYAKYNVDGVPAFYILPGHASDPGDIIDFKILGYNSGKKEFVYCYLTALNNSNASLKGKAESPEKRTIEPAGKNCSENVLVLMSYNPVNLDYNVFYSSAKDRNDMTQVENNNPNADMDNEDMKLVATISDSGIIANRLLGRDEYFIFDDMTAYVFGSDGSKISANFYKYEVEAEVDELSKSLAQKTGNEGKEYTYSVSDVIMDGYRNIYIPITIEFLDEEDMNRLEEEDDSSFEEGDEANAANDDTLDQSVYSTILAIYNMDIGGSNGVPFYSYNENWGRQVSVWLQDNGRTFSDRDSLDAYLRNYSMDRIKKGEVGGYPDSFTTFESSGYMNAKLGYIADVFRATVKFDRINYTRELTFGGLLRGDYSIYDNDFISMLQFYSNRGNYERALLYSYGSYTSSIFKSMKDEEEIRLAVETAKSNLVAMTQARIVRKYSLPASVSIPWVKPGAWSGSSNSLPIATQYSGYDKMEAFYAYKASDYSNRSARYYKISYDDRYWPVGDPRGISYFTLDYSVAARSNQKNDYFQTYSSDTKRTFYYQVVKEEVDGEGNTVQTVVLASYTESLGSYPVVYQLKFPEGTRISWIEEVGYNEMAAATRGIGAIYYSEDPYHEGCTAIRYNDGTIEVLSDNGVSGIAVEAGMLYDSDSKTEAIVLVTSEGMQLYPLNGNRYKVSRDKFISMDDIDAASSSYAVTYVDADWMLNRHDGYDVAESQNEIIKEKMEEDSSSDVLEISGMCLMNSEEVIVPTVSSGLTLINFKDKATSINLQSGAYFAVFKQSGNEYVVVGYDTDEYNYQPTDAALARYYTMDLKKAVDSLQDQALQRYVENMYIGYLNRTHRLVYKKLTDADIRQAEKRGEDLVPYTVGATTDAAADETAVKLFFSDKDTREKELKRIADSYGFNLTAATLEYAKDLSEQAVMQREALTELYRFAGLVDGTSQDNVLLDKTSKIPREAWLLEQEGRLLSVDYTNGLEGILVELALSNRAISRMSGSDGKALYKDYRTQMLTVSQLNDRGSNADLNKKNTGNSVNTDDEFESMRQMAYYLSVVQDLKTKLARALTADTSVPAAGDVLQGLKRKFINRGIDDLTSEEINDVWEKYMDGLMRAINPYCPVSDQELGLSDLLIIMGYDSNAAMIDMDALTEEVSEIRRVADLEALIISYKLKEAVYQNIAKYQEDFQAYSDGVNINKEGNPSFGSQSEKEEEFRKMSFYQVILDIQEKLEKENKEFLEGTTWEAKLADILKRCGTGIVLTTDYE